MFDSLKQLPPDPILGLSAAFKEDKNPNKIDLGVGVYKDEHGNTPILDSVVKAQAILQQTETSKVYIAPAGNEGFRTGMLELLFGKDHKVLLEQRAACAQSPGGTGALRILAELINRAKPGTTVWISDPSWANHIPLMADAGLNVEKYPYFDKTTGGIKFEEMVAALKKVEKDDLVLLHGCCHNPTGADLTHEQWDTVLELAKEREFLPFIDTAYQGFGDGLDEDAYGLRLLADNLPELVISASCSKNFGLYRERVGLAVIIGKDAETRTITQSQIVNVARGIYSMPPSYGAALVDIILNDQQLKSQWVKEVEEMRHRMKDLRAMLVSKLAANGAKKDFDFINQQKGMFSFLCIEPEQVRAVREKHAIYFVDSSRVNIAGVSHENIDYLAEALVSVL